MPTRVFLTAEFSRFARKEKISDALFVEAVERAERGLIDADLGGGLVKLRIARPNEGRSGGYRTIVAYVHNHRAFFVFGFAKNDRANIPPQAVRYLKEYGKLLQGLSEESLVHAIRERELMEIER